MLLAYGFGMPPKSTSMTVPDPRDPDRSLTFELRPDLPIQVQAERLYQRARKLEDGAAIAAQRRAEALAELTHLAELRLAVDAATDQPALDALRDRLIEHGILRATTQELKARRSPTGRERQLQKMTKGHNFRCYDSAEGHPIMVGRSNQQNDRLSVSVARGNDLWFHVGRGYAGSHVVMRLEKGKLASLESLLDAATLAIHFSKARNAARCEVIYTLAKNVRKPKGLPPGRVTTTNTKTLQVDVEPDRLRRLLDSGDHGED
jgi:predicted ribosome quality control (RQC) complex YloA/Tae2 family protein